MRNITINRKPNKELVRNDITALVVGSIATLLFVGASIVLPTIRLYTLIAVGLGIAGIVCQSICLYKRLHARREITTEDIIKAIDIVCTEKEKDILYKRRGINSDKCYTFRDLAEIYDMSFERLRQIEQNSLFKVKNYLETH